MNYFETDLVAGKVMTGPVWIVKMMNGRHINIHKSWESGREWPEQGGFDGRRQQTASPMLTAIMSGGVGISGKE